MRVFIDPSFWTDDDVLSLSYEQKTAFLWILTNGRMNSLGVQVLSKAAFRMHTGLDPGVLDELITAMPRAFHLAGRTLWVRRFAAWQWTIGQRRSGMVSRSLANLLSGCEDSLRLLISSEYPEIAAHLRNDVQHTKSEHPRMTDVACVTDASEESSKPSEESSKPSEESSKPSEESCRRYVGHKERKGKECIIRGGVGENGDAGYPQALAVAKLYPKPGDVAQTAWAIVSEIEEGVSLEAIKTAIEQYAEAVSQWPPGDRRFVPAGDRWVSRKRYLEDPAEWQREDKRPARLSREEIEDRIGSLWSKQQRVELVEEFDRIQVEIDKLRAMRP